MLVEFFFRGECPADLCDRFSSRLVGVPLEGRPMVRTLSGDRRDGMMEIKRSGKKDAHS